MAHSCIVQCCGNNRTNVKISDEYISFFRLPHVDVMREGWLKRIGKVKMPANHQHARICSVHFTEQSFMNPTSAEIQTATRNKRRRRLVPHAVPTLHLTEDNNPSVRQQLDFKIIRKEFVLHTPSLVSKKRPPDAEEISCDQDELNVSALNQSPEIVPLVTTPGLREKVSDQFAENMTPKSLHNTAWFGTRDQVDDTPTGENPKHGVRAIATFPRRSERLARCRKRHHDIATNEAMRCTAKPKNLNYSYTVKEKKRESVSEEGSPTWKRRKQFITEHLCERETANRAKPENEDPQTRIKWLTEQINYLQALVQFYKNSKTKDEGEIQQLRAQCAAYALDLKKEQDEKNKMFVEINELQKLNEELYTKLASAGIEQNACKQQQKSIIHSILQPYFTEGQIRCILEGRKWVKWSVDDFAAAISLRSVSPKAYRYLRNKLNFPFPSLSSLQRWALAKFDISEGFLSDVLTVMREKSKALTPMGKIAVLTFDEMALTPEICFDSRLEQMVGPCTKVQVIMVRGLFDNWKQPIYYKFDQPMNKSIFNEALSLLDQAGYEVACTCDIGNEGVWGELGINSDTHCFPHPTINNAFVYAFADVPHLLKLLRNWYVDDGFNLSGCRERFTRAILQTIVDKSAGSDLCVAHRLTQRVLDARNSMRQAVWPAARIWSRSVAKAVEWGGKHKLFATAEYQKFSDFILTVNDWFDVHNSQTKYGAHKGVNGYGVNVEDQTRILMLMSSYMESMRVGARKKLMPFQEGVLISNASLRGLHEYLGEKFPNDYKYVITRRLQQDILENFFSYIRAMGATRDHPSAYDFKYRLRWYILGKHSHAIFTNNRNSEEDMSASCISSSLSTSTPLQSSNSSAIVKLHAGGTAEDSRHTECDINSILQNCSASQISNDSTTDYTAEPVNLYEPDPDGDIVLTEELFKEIINISPETIVDNTDNESLLKDGSDNYLHDSPHELDEIADVHRVGTVLRESTSSSDGSNNCIQEAGLAYVAGYVAHRFRYKYPDLGEPTHNLEDIALHDQSDWIRLISRGHLIQPSKNLLRVSRIMEKCFVKFHGTKFSKDVKVVQKVVQLVKNEKEYESLPEEVLQCLVRTRTYIRMREINKKMYVEKEKQRNKKKPKKFSILSKKKP